MVAAVGEGADEGHLAHDEVVHRDLGQMAPDGDVDDGAARPDGPDRGGERGVDAGAFEGDVRSCPTGEIANGGGRVIGCRVEHDLGAGGRRLRLRAAAGSTTITVPAPVASSAAMVASPIGPAPKTAAVPPSGSPESRAAW